MAAVHHAGGFRPLSLPWISHSAIDYPPVASRGGKFLHLTNQQLLAPLKDSFIRIGEARTTASFSSD
jgi:hypothetical protein